MVQAFVKFIKLLAVVLLVLVACWVWMIGGGANARKRMSLMSRGSSPASRGLKAEELALASHQLQGSWVEWDSLDNDEFAWSGSCFVVQRSGNRLELLTNSHCLSLGELGKADGGLFTPFVEDYQLTVRFASGAERKVLRMAEEATDLDLARLEVDAGGLEAGRDFVIIDLSDLPRPEPGRTVVVVGSPLGWKNSQTFGRISALRNRVEGLEGNHIQIDAPMNPGNSGGPVLMECEEGQTKRYRPVGIATWGMKEGEGLNFAISVREARDAQYHWSDANPRGAAKLIREVYKLPCNPK